MSRIRKALRDARYALPRLVEWSVRGPSAAGTARRCERLHRSGMGAAVAYFQAGDARPEEIVAANRMVASLLASRSADVYLSVKAPPLAFDAARLRSIAEAAAAASLALLFDAHAADHADRTLDVVWGLLPEFPRTGVALPARWRRSLADAVRFRDTSARIRIVKGEWADPSSADQAVEANYLALISALAGRAGMVAVATHDPGLAERSLAALLAAGTPCELEQLRGLPRRRTMAVARRLGVPVRVYLPFGPGWWPYAVDKALGRPYLLSWAMRDLLGPGRTDPIPGIQRQPAA
jgi:proline dehydrogenase